MQESLATMIVSLCVFVVGFCWFCGELCNRIYPNGNKQKLVTTCQVEEKINKEIKANTSKKWDGYFLSSSGSKIYCNIMETRENDYEVEYNRLWEFPPYTTMERRLIHKKDFYPIYTNEELSDKIDKRKKGRVGK